MRSSWIGRQVAGAAAAAVALGGLVAAPAAAEGRSDAPPCVSSTSDWRYTFVTNGCDQPYAVQVAYTDGTLSPCRQTQPGDRITFAGYGVNANYVTGLHLC